MLKARDDEMASFKAAVMAEQTRVNAEQIRTHSAYEEMAERLRRLESVNQQTVQ